MRPIVKICGFTRPEDVRMCARHGADIAGFVVDYPRPVPWNLDAETAKVLMRSVPKTAQTCIVTGGPPEKTRKLALELTPDYLQLHFNETAADTAYLVSELRNAGIKIIKAVFPGTSEKDALEFCSAGVHALLYDPRTPDAAAHGGMADLSAYIKLQRAASRPVILAGGITPGNAAEMIRRAKPWMIDLMTGVECSPGMKDEEKVIALFQALRDDLPPV